MRRAHCLSSVGPEWVGDKQMPVKGVVDTLPEALSAGQVHLSLGSSLLDLWAFFFFFAPAMWPVGSSMSKYGVLTTGPPVKSPLLDLDAVFSTPPSS